MGAFGPAQVQADAFVIALAVEQPAIDRTQVAQAMVDRNRRTAGLADKDVALANTRAIGQVFVGVAGVEPAAGVVEHHAAHAVVV